MVSRAGTCHRYTCSMGPMGRTMTIGVLAVAGAAILAIAVVLAISPRVGTKRSGRPLPRLVDIPDGGWAWLNGRTVFFGHQSVGYNIVDGIGDLAGDGGLMNLPIVQGNDAGGIGGAAFVHAPVGRNREPESKLAEFREILEKELGDKVDVALLKFCYVDVQRGCDPQRLLDSYCQTIEALKARFANVIFVHVTVPLCGPPAGAIGILKVNIKRALGRATVLDDNLVRSQYNELLRQRFVGKEPVLDVAGYESIDPRGMQWFVVWKGHEVPVLVPSYTDDGGHLNVVGRRHVAEQLLIELAKLAEASR